MTVSVAAVTQLSGHWEGGSRCTVSQSETPLCPSLTVKWMKPLFAACWSRFLCEIWLLLFNAIHSSATEIALGCGRKGIL